MTVRQLLCGLLLAGATTATAQYYGTTVFVEGFDGDAFPQTWSQENAVPTNTTRWELGDIGKPQFSLIEPSSRRSARIMVNGNDTRLTLTSPEIDATGLGGLQVGFYGYELNYAFRGGIDFRFRVSNDGGASWTDLFSTVNGDSFAGTPVGGWNLYRYQLPAKFDDSSLLLQFYVDASPVHNPQSLAGYIDGVFVSLLPEVDPAITDINYSTSDVRPTEGVFGKSEPLTLTMHNCGTRELAEAEFYYSVDGGAEHSRVCVFPAPVAPGADYTFSFPGGIDLSATGHRRTIVAGVRADGDPIAYNNKIKAYAENLVVSVPYIPFFHDEDGVKTVSDDGWKTFENNSEYGWDYEDWYGFFWYVEPEWNDEPNDAYLVSRPIAMHAGNSYRIEFSAVTEDEGYGANAMKVYASTDAGMAEGLHEIWSNDDITDENALSQSAVFTAATDGIYYIGFHSLSEAGAGVMRLENIAVYRNVDTDAAVVAVHSPQPSAYRYTDAETVKATIANYGSGPIAAGTARVCLEIDGKTVLSEPLADALAPNSTVEFTFAGTVDLSDLGTVHIVKLGVELPGDEDPSNDAVEFRLESDLTLAPYIPDMGTSTVKGYDIARWTVYDNNGDGYTFSARSDAMLDSYIFSYGGGLYGFTTVTLPGSDEALTSRHILLEGGKTYKLNYLSRVGMEGGSLPLAIKLVNTADASVLDIASAAVDTFGYVENSVTFTPASDGIYQLRFEVRDDKAIDYRMYLGGFRLAEQFGCDLSAEKIVLPSSYVSEIRSYPVGLVIRNNGTAVVDSFVLEAVSESIGNRKQKFTNVALEPDGEYTVYFNEDFVFDASADEQLHISVSTDGDEYAGNNSVSRTISYIEPYDLPFSLLPDEALSRSAAFNLNRDAFAFTADRSMGLGYIYLANGETEANDYVATPAMNLRAGKAVRVSFCYYVLEGDTADIDVFAYSAATNTTVPVISLRELSQTVMSRYTGFFEVPVDGAYSICMQPRGKTRSLFINAAVTAEEADVMPDLAITRVISHSQSAVMGDNESVEVEFVNKSEQSVEGVPFELQVGERTYHAQFVRSAGQSGEDESYTVTFCGVDLSAPGTYNAVCRAIVPLDANPADNEMAFDIVSLPVVDVAVAALNSPVSGKLGHSEAVSVSIANKGKGAVGNLKLRCEITSPGRAGTVLEGMLDQQLADGATVAYTFPDMADMDAEGVYTFTITAMADGDVNPDDNTLTVQVNSTHKDFDAGVSALVSPADAALDSGESVTIAVTNYGEAHLFDVPVSVAVNLAGDDAPQTLSGTVPSVPLGETVEYTFPGSVDMKRCGVYTVTVATALNGDIDSSNDAFTAHVRCLTQDVGVSAILSPVSGEELGVCDVTVEVTNYGEAAVSMIPMKYQIGTMPQLAVMNRPLEPGESAEFTFPVPYEFTSYRKATVRATTMLDNDANPGNDGMELEVENIKSGTPDVTVSTGVWPNPTCGVVNVSAAHEIVRVQAFDMAGQLLAEFAGNGSCEMQLTLEVPAGRYMLRIIQADGSAAVSHIVKI